MPLIETRELKKSYFETDEPVEVLRGINLSVNAGEMIGIVGQSGVGKTTLLYLLGALERPTDGKVLFEGREIFAKANDRELARFRNHKLGFIFQFHHLIPEFSAVENVMMPGLLGNIPRKQAREMALWAMSTLGVDHRASHRPGELSGGEQQRVAVARALVMNPKVVLADEPTGNLDVDTAERLQEEFLRLNLEKGITFIIVTHNENLAVKLPRVYKLEKGLARNLEK